MTTDTTMSPATETAMTWTMTAGLGMTTTLTEMVAMKHGDHYPL